jgi:hypothetical protein
MGLRPGSRWSSSRGGTEVVVVRAPGEEVTLQCSGAAMVAAEGAGPSGRERADGSTAAGDPSSEPQVLLGKRYEGVDVGIEVLCTKPGPGPLSVGGVDLVEKGAKPLPSSD